MEGATALQGISGTSSRARDSDPSAAAEATDAAHSHVSTLLRNRLATGRAIEHSESSRVRGAVLLTDVEGFTSHMQRLTRSGPEGLEELAGALNSHFVELAHEIYGYGGDILCVAGDSFLSLWNAPDDGELAEATARAAQAGLAVQAAAGLQPPLGGQPMRTRIGVAAGALDIALVGGVNGRWELMPVGEPLEQVAVAERGAPAGGVVLAPSAWELLSGRADGRRWATGWWR